MAQKIMIAVLQRGWVVVGKFLKEGSQCKLSNASVVRKWGTTKGLGEIASGGPTKNTVLDSVPDVHFHELTAVMLIECAEDEWAKHCKGH